VLRLDPAYPRAHLALGSLARARGDVNTAERELEAELARHPGDAQTLAQLGYVHLAQGHSDRARAEWYEAVKRTPEDATTWLALARAESAAGQTARASAAYRRVAALVPTGPPADEARAFLARHAAQ
jgi:Tfp pilus assembly protein PilF